MWRGTRNIQLVQERIDKGLVNDRWKEMWPRTSVIHGTVRESDHCPLIVNTDPRKGRDKPHFRFEAFWLNEPGCREVVKQSWLCQVEEGWSHRWRRKIHNCRRSLQDWSRGKFKARKIEISNLTKAIDNLQMDWANNADQIRETIAEIDRLEAQEEQFWKQWSRIRWL